MIKALITRQDGSMHTLIAADWPELFDQIAKERQENGDFKWMNAYEAKTTDIRQGKRAY